MEGQFMTREASVFRGFACGLGLALCLGGGAAAQDAGVVTGQIEWGLWIDDDGCQHWWADGGVEGYMVPRRNPRTGKPVCLKKQTCLVEGSDGLFSQGSAVLTDDGRARLAQFFRSTDAFGFAVYGHTDDSGQAGQNLRLSDARAGAVADVARSVGASVEREIGLGESRPVATNDTATGMAKNRRVEIVCYRW
jgi:outer membrane protein OmpA-like peptidoglycan-associated protein